MKFTVISLLLSLISYAHEIHDKPLNDIKVSAQRFIQSLNKEQKAKTVLNFDDAKRKLWDYLPDKYLKPNKKRPGMLLKDMNAQQSLLMQSFISSVLSHKGHLKVNTIMALEEILFQMTKSKIRDPELYYTTIFGTPSNEKPWAWRFEGHHLSINITIIKGKFLSVTPSFWGSNPGIVKQGNFKGLKTLAAEEELGRELINSLNDEQKKLAIISNKAPKDIYSKASSKVDKAFFDKSKGISFDQLDKKQQEKLLNLIKVYVDNFQAKYHKHLNSPLKETGSLIFAWSGSLKAGEGHYYRIVTKNHLIEYDNVQNGAEHAHCVWRQFDGDFGLDLLKEHYQKEHK